jgi:hypothetical protein
MPEQVEKNEEIIKVGETIESEGLSFREKLEIAMKQQPATAIEENVLIEDEIEPEEQVSKTAIFVSFAKKTGQKIVRMAKAVSKFVSPTIDKAIEKIKQINIKDAKKIYGFIPHASKIKKLFSSFTFNQKIYTLCALVLIFIVPIFIVRFLNRPKTPTITQLETIQPTLSEILTNEKNINLFAQKQTVLSQNDIVNTLVINTGTAIVTKNSVVVIENGEQKEYALPENSGATVKAAFMKDLSLVFILTDKNKLVSFSPVSTKFTEDNISLPTNVSDDFIGTYLTYLYILDPQDNQIYRYPRATGGFGDKTNWLKDSTPLSGISDMTIDDNIYCIQNNSVLKLFKGKKQDLNLEASNTPVHFDNIFTTIDSDSLYVLDAKNSRIVQYSKADGSITKQYFNEAILNGKSLSIDETNKLAYISTSSELISVSIQ